MPAGERPFQEIRVRVRQVKPGKSDRVGSRVVDFHPGIVLTKIIRRSSDVLRLDFVNPNRRKWCKARGCGVGAARTVGGRRSKSATQCHPKHDVAAVIGSLVNFDREDIGALHEVSRRDIKWTFVIGINHCS